MKVQSWLVLALALAPCTAAAQPPVTTGEAERIRLERPEIISATCDFRRPISSVISTTSTVLRGTDATPSDIISSSGITSTTVQGTPCFAANTCVYVVLTGAGIPTPPPTPAAANPNPGVIYQVDILAGLANGDRWLCHLRVDGFDQKFKPAQ